ncbi:lysophospholipase [Gleimia sp. 6138-11-ORH1]|uniref:lysophospholipase n=1 Tax=Gleimia sp. 6138-11-ORH1 TaxID=2973937 RepID=UPI0021695187|nr:lysophospholipase [Gleimia sp. 6138-11-ORH1]MCS4484640.1 lysophospholipase [Gleimia sp. 6138-11-ORH1]
MQLYVYKTKQEPLADILLLHGLAEHQGRYSQVIRWFNEAGFDVYTYDQLAHGTSLVRKGQPVEKCVVDIKTLIGDHFRARGKVAKVSRTQKLFLFGHSMGGLITAVSGLLRPEGIMGVVLSGPAVDSLIPRSVTAAALRLARKYPAMPTVEMDPTEVALLPEVIAAYQSDPLNYVGPVPLLTAATLTNWSYFVHDNAGKWSLPLLVMHGEFDKVVSPSGSAHLVKQAQAAGVEAEYRVVLGEKHEIFNGPQAPQLLANTVTWLKAHL